MLKIKFVRELIFRNIVIILVEKVTLEFLHIIILTTLSGKLFDPHLP